MQCQQDALRDEIKGLSANLGATHSKLEAELANKEKTRKNTKKREAKRKEHAVQRAQECDTEIVLLQGALESQQKRNEILASFAADAEASISRMQQATEQLEHQLSAMRLQRDHVSERVSKIAKAKKAVIKRNKAIKKERENNEEEMNSICVSLLDSRERLIEKAGLALIQRDLAVAQLQVPNASSTSTTFQNGDLVRAVEERKPPTTGVLGGSSGGKAMRQMNKSFMSSEPVR
jgi:chromosome segregation ATPase